MRGKNLFWTGCLLFLSACGGGGGVHQPPPPPPPPSITLTTLVPSYTVAGTGDNTVYVNGNGFTTSSVVQWNGAALPTTFGTSQIVSASISSSLITLPGTTNITVKDSSSGATSNSLPFGIASAAATTAGVIAMITVAPDGSPANDDSLVQPSISATGRYVAFQSAATNLAPGPSSGYQEIYERDTCIGAPSGCTPNTIRITVTYDGSPANGHSRYSAISADGRFISFDSQATNILPGSSACAGPLGSCVFFRDTCTGVPTGCNPATIAVSLNTSGGISTGGVPAMTPDGRFVAFQSGASDLVTGANGGQVYLRDTCLGAPSNCAPTTTLVSLSSSGAQGNANSGVAAASAAGRYLAFQSWATNIVPNTTVVPGDFWRDTCIGASSPCTPGTMRVDVTASGGEPNNGVFNLSIPAISSDGRLVAFSSTATNLVSTNVNGMGNIYVRDTCAGATSGCTPTTSLVSLGNDGSVGNWSSGNQSMTADGRFVAFASLASNLVPGDTFPAGGFKDIFVRDTCYGVASGCTPSTVRVSVTNTPNPETQANDISDYPAMSADGHYVVFLSAATDLVPGGSNGHQMVFLAKTGF